MARKGYQGPLPSSDFRKQVATEVLTPFTDIISGEFAASVSRPLGIARFKGRVTNVILSVAKDGSSASVADTPRFSGEVTINKVSIFTTKPSIGHVSGESATIGQKTTWAEAGDTGIIQPVINQATASFVIGDVLDWTAIYSGSGSPTEKIQSPGIVVEVEPDI